MSDAGEPESESDSEPESGPDAGSDEPEAGATPPSMDTDRERDMDREAKTGTESESASGSETETETQTGSDGEQAARPTEDEMPSEPASASSNETDADPDLDTDPDAPTSSTDEPTPEHEDREWCQETVDQATRKKVLRRDGHRCQFYGEAGVGAGGSATLEVHHIDRTPEHCAVHDLENLITLCEACHSWMHKRPTAEAVPVDLTPADREVLLPYDYQILRILAMRGPATVGEIVEYLYPEHSRMAVRERLWTLMALDTMVERRDTQLVDQDAYTGAWALCHPGEGSPVDCSARGRIPEDADTLQTRVEDELVRLALARGCDRGVVADAFDITERTTWHKERRAQAYDIPLEAVDGDERLHLGTAASGEAD